MPRARSGRFGPMGTRRQKLLEKYARPQFYARSPKGHVPVPGAVAGSDIDISRERAQLDATQSRKLLRIRPFRHHEDRPKLSPCLH
jgi:hypothetical protein